MAKPVDILLDGTLDVYAVKGDFVLGDATFQNQQLLLISEKGEFKQDPQVGVGIRSYLLDDASIHEMQQEIVKQFEVDGMKINELSGNSWPTTEIDAEYE